VLIDDDGHAVLADFGTLHVICVLSLNASIIS